MKSNELRIGNWIKDGKQIRQVEGWMFIQEIKDFEPIPLTPEILIACGFEILDTEMSGCNVYQKGLWRIAHKYRDDNQFHLWHKQVSPPTWRLSELEYLHQLQNLYHSLTGNEIDIKF